MKLYRLIGFILLSLFATAKLVSAGSQSQDYSDYQHPPLTIDPSQECTHGDPSPILNKNRYRETQYSRKILQEKPLKTVEELQLEDDSNLKIEQTGCEDMFGVITIRIGSKRQNMLDYSAKLLTSLDFDPDAFFLNSWMKQIAQAVENEKNSKIFKQKKRSTICLQRIPGENGEIGKDQECYADMAIIQTSNELRITFVERP